MLGTGLPAGTITVTNPNDSGTGSLRQALADAADLPGPDVVNFSPAVFNGEPVKKIQCTR